MKFAGSLQNWLYDGLSSPSKDRGATTAESHRTRRRGSLLVETAIGVALAAVVMIAVAQLVAVVAKQRREVAQTNLAAQEVANVMERVMVLPWDQLTTEAAERFVATLPPAAALDDPQLSITVSDSDDPLPTKQIEVALSWRDLARRRVEPVRVAAWKHQPPAAE